MKAQPFNDEPCQAISLIPSPNCVWQEFDNIGATNDPSVPGPQCGGYNAANIQDVWFVIEVPSNGAIKIDNLEGTLDNTSMAVYTGPDCNNLTRIDCDGNSSVNGAMPFLNLTGLTPGSYLFIRIWDLYRAPNAFGNNEDPAEEGTFSICVQSIGGLFDPTGTSSTTSYDCNNTPPAGNTCLTATPICSFDGYCGSTAGYGANYWHSGSQGLGGPLIAQGIFCGSIENNSFISFVAAEESVVLEVEVWGGGCYDGIQFMMFGDRSGLPACGSNNLESYGCLFDEMPPGSNPFIATGLTPGQQYYLMVDGFGGDVCDYQINAISGVLVNMSAGKDQTICLGDSAILTVFNAGSGTITWTGPGITNPTGDTVYAAPPGVGTFQYIVTAPTISPFCTGSATDTDTLLVTVQDASPISALAGICDVNDEVTITAFGAVSYIWEPPVNIDITSGNVVHVSPTSTTTYTVYGASSNGCVDDASVSVNACASPCSNPSITITDPISACLPNAADLSAAVSVNPVNANITYHTSWSNANSGSNPMASTMVTSGGNYFVRAEDPNDGSCYSAETINVVINTGHSVAVTSMSCFPADTGVSVVTLPNQDGCDSVVTTTTNLLVSHALTVIDSSCNPVDTGTVVYNLSNGNGCDSIVTVNTSLTGLPMGTFNDSICANEIYTLPSGVEVFGPGTYLDTVSGFSCDSVVMIYLTSTTSGQYAGLYAATMTGYNKVNPLTGAIMNTHVADPNSLGWQNGAFTMHESNATLYWISDQLTLQSLNLNNGVQSSTATDISTLPFFWGLKYFDGFLYTVTTALDNDKQLVRIDPSTGNMDVGFIPIEIDGSASYNISPGSSPVINPLNGHAYLPLFGNALLSFDIAGGTGQIVTLSGYLHSSGLINLLEINEKTGEMFAFSGFSDVVEITMTGPTTATLSLVKSLTTGSGLINPISTFDADNELYIFQAQTGCSPLFPMITIDVNTGQEWCSDPGSDVFIQMEYLNCSPPSTLREVFDFNVLLYPNPTRDVVWLGIDLIQAERIDVEVFDVSGALISVEKFEGSVGRNTIEMDLSGLSDGVYVVSVRSGRDRFIGKVVKF